MTYQTVVLWSLTIGLIIWCVLGFVFLIADEWARSKQRKDDRNAAYARNHFRQTERFRNDVE